MKERPNFPLMRQTDIQSIYHMQMPRWLFSDPRYADMSLDAKVAYTFLLNRFQLSRRNGWTNERGEVFVIFPRKELAKELRVCEKRVTAAFQTLAERNLIWEKRCGRGDANQIYNEHFIPRGWRLSYTKLSSGVSLYLTGYCRDCGGDLEERVLLTNGLSSDKLLKAERTRNMRYKRPALASIGVEDLIRELEEIQEACTDIHWFTDQDDETLLNALDGDEEDAYEFRIAFADLEAKANHLSDLFYELENHDDPAWQVYNDCTVALIGNRYQVAGFDMDEEDYFSLTSYEQNLACTEAGKRVMRMTKPAMLSTIGQCVCILVSFLDLRQSYDYLKATFDIFAGYKHFPAGHY